MTHRWLQGAFVTASAFLLGLGGCSSTRPTKYYTLSALSTSATAQPAASVTRTITVGVGPVELPQYVDRPQIVTRESQNQFQLAEFDVWAEPLEENFARVLVENLSSLLAAERIAILSWDGPLLVTYRVVVDVTRFHSRTGGEVVLTALWSILGNEKREVLVSRQSSFTESAGSLEYEATVAAMSRTVAALSRDIAAEIRSLSPTTVAQSIKK